MNPDDVTTLQEAVKNLRESAHTIRALTAANAALAAERDNLMQTSLDLCPTCHWRTVLPGVGCLNCARVIVQPAKPTYRAYKWENGLTIACPVCPAKVGDYCDISVNRSATRPPGGSGPYLHRARTDGACVVPPIPAALALPFMPALVPIDLSKADKHECPGIDDTGVADYLVFIDGSYHVGNFGRQWFGLSFAGWLGGTRQFDAPGFNRSTWRAIWRIEPDGDTLKAMLFPDPPKPTPTTITCRECNYTWKLIEWDADKYTCPKCGEDHEPSDG